MRDRIPEFAEVQQKKSVLGRMRLGVFVFASAKPPGPCLLFSEIRNHSPDGRGVNA